LPCNWPAAVRIVSPSPKLCPLEWLKRVGELSPDELACIPAAPASQSASLGSRLVLWELATRLQLHAVTDNNLGRVALIGRDRQALLPDRLGGLPNPPSD